MNINGQTVRKWLCYGVFYSVVHVLDSNVTVLLGWMPVNHVWKLPLPIGPPTVMEKCEPLWTISISSSPFTKRFACKNRIANTQKKDFNFFMIFIPVQRELSDALVIVLASRNTNGTGFWPTIQTMTVVVYSWTGFYFLHVAHADVSKILSNNNNKDPTES